MNEQVLKWPSEVSVSQKIHDEDFTINFETSKSVSRIFELVRTRYNNKNGKNYRKIYLYILNRYLKYTQ